MIRAAAFAIALAVPMLPVSALAQDSDVQLWTIASATGEVDGAKLTLETVTRTGDRNGFYDAQIGGWVATEVGDGVEIGFGYRHAQFFDHGHETTNEERLRQQVSVPLGKLGEVRVAARLRLEERFISGGGEIAVRVRPQLRLSLPLNAHKLTLVASHEAFVNLNGTAWGVRGGYERMRTAIGLSFPLTGRLSGEAHYLNQYRFGRHGARDQMDNVAAFGVTLAL